MTEQFPKSLKFVIRELTIYVRKVLDVCCPYLAALYNELIAVIASVAN